MDTPTTRTDILSFLKSLLDTTKSQREYKADLIKQINEVQDELNKTELGKKLLALRMELAETSGELVELENDVRSIAVKAYEATGDKRPVPGIEVKQYTTVVITNDNAALKWAAENAPSTVTLNTTKFNAAVRLLELPFIEIIEEPRGTIASDLSKVE